MVIGRRIRQVRGPLRVRPDLPGLASRTTTRLFDAGTQDRLATQLTISPQRINSNH
jgi:hypothetical protein